MLVLKRNSTGPDVIMWQNFLISEGYQLTADGQFGRKTEDLTKQWQLTENLIADGQVGPKSWAKSKLKLTSKTEPMPANSKPILISAGHTTDRKGDRGVAGNGLIEGVEAVLLRDALANAIRERGHRVIEDGADGISEPLKKAIALARTASIAIEIHFNGGPPKATGIEVLSKPKHKKLAVSLAGAIHSATGLPLRGGAGGWKSDSSGQHHRLGFCEAGGLVVEVCFMSNAADMAAYKNNFSKIVSNLTDAILNQ